MAVEVHAWAILLPGSETHPHLGVSSTSGGLSDLAALNMHLSGFCGPLRPVRYKTQPEAAKQLSFQCEGGASKRQGRAFAMFTGPGASSTSGLTDEGTSSASCSKTARSAETAKDAFFGKNIFPSEDRLVSRHIWHGIPKLSVWKAYRQTWVKFASSMYSVAMDVLKG